MPEENTPETDMRRRRRPTHRQDGGTGVAVERRLGRPLALTPEIAAAIEEAVREGASLGLAARRLGIGETTALEWRRRGEGRDGRPATELLAEFAVRIRKAEAEDEFRRVKLIAKVGEGGGVISRKTITRPDGAVVTEERYLPPQWTPIAWHLERRHPEEWARRERVEHAGTVETKFPDLVSLLERIHQERQAALASGTFRKLPLPTGDPRRRLPTVTS